MTPDTIEKSTEKFKDFLGDLNKFLIDKSLPEIKDYQILGSAGYYKQDQQDKKEVTYGDIDVMVVIPIESAEESSDKKKEYIKNVIEFIETSGQNYIDIESAKRSDGKQIVIKIDEDTWVQLDLLYTTKIYKDWFAARFTPERGIKGFTMGGMYSALAEVLNIRIGDTGVRAKFKDGKIVSPMLRKDVVDKLISNSPSTFLRDLSDFLAGLFGKKITTIDPNLSAHSGVNPNDVKLKDLTTGVLGFAKTLDANGILTDLGFDYKSFIKAIKDKYAEKMIEQYAKKEKKATTPETQASIDTNVSEVMSAEVSNRIAGDESVANAMAAADSAEASARVAGDESLAANLSTEVENRIADVDAEESRAIVAETSLQNNIDAEASVRIVGDESLEAAMDAADLSLDTKVSTETARAESAESSLEDRIDYIVSNVDPAALDGFSFLEKTSSI